MSLLDRVLAEIAPVYQMRRTAARMNILQLERLSASYDAARRSRRTQGWLTDGGSANAQTRNDLLPVRERSRDLVRNNPYASAGLDMLVSYQIGTGIVPRSKTGDDALDQLHDALWEEWAPHSDIAGRLDVYGQQALMARTRSESGEVLTFCLPLPYDDMRRRGSPVPLALQVVEPDYLDSSIEQDLAGGAVIRQGVEMDRSGRPVAYHLFRHHPGEPGRMSWSGGDTRRVEARYLLHTYRQDRPGQLRGVPDLASVMMRLRLLDEYEDAAMMQAMAQACVAAFVTSNGGPATGPLESGKPGAADAMLRQIEPGMIERLLPGESVDFLVPSGSGAFPEFTRHQLRAISTGYGLTYDLMTGDLSNANYSSLRAGRLSFKRRLESAQWLMIVPQWCQPVHRAFVSAAQSVGRLPARPTWPVEWGPPHFEMVDPLKDTMALRMQLRLGITTWAQAVAEAGWHPKRQAAELAEVNAMFDDLGLILDGDPRRTGNGGTAQDAAQNADVEIAATGVAGG